MKETGKEEMESVRFGEKKKHQNGNDREGAWSQCGDGFQRVERAKGCQ